MTAKHDQLVIVQKYETFLAYVYPIAQNLPRKHGVAKEMFLRDMLGQVELFIVAAKSGQISRIREADAGLTMLRFWIRFLSSPTCGVMTQQQHRTASVQLAEVGRLVGAWLRSHPGSGKA